MVKLTLGTPLGVLWVFVWCQTVQLTSGAGSVTGGISALFEYQTTQLLKDKDDGVVAAFGDFNADELGDVFVITNFSQSVSVLLAQENKAYERKSILNTSSVVITSVVPADFNGDVQMDILIVTREVAKKSGPYKIQIYWGNRTLSSVDPTPYTLNATLRDEPLVFDYNADMYPDLLCEPAGQPGVRQVWLGHHNKTFTLLQFPFNSSTTLSPFSAVQSHAFVDLNNDLSADVILTTVDGYEIWLNKDGVFQYNTTRPYPEAFSDGIVGQSSFTDLDLDQHVDQIVPGCLDKACTKSAIYTFNVSHNEWHERLGPEGFTMNGETWNFVPPGLSEYRDVTNQSFPVSVRVGDYDLDGFPDAVAVLSNTNSQGDRYQRVFLLDNVPCDPLGGTCDIVRRKFKLHEMDKFAEINQGVMVATFYDIYEDGIPDIVLVAMKKVDGKFLPKIVLMKNEIAQDSCFVKITVVSGLCGKSCSSKTNPYGVNYPGPTISYSTVKTDGTSAKSTGTQLTQSAHYALQTPYQMFGLGPTPNFIDNMDIGIPHPPGEDSFDKTWPFIIPNSQLVVVPAPPDQPNSWQLKLYVTPSQLIYFTGVALLGTCVFVAVIVGILHWREKREDMLEKKQEAQKFHFDAM